MDGERTQNALLRIDTALTRIEVAAANAAHGSDLAARHERLRDAVTSALGQLDGLIAKHDL